MKKNDICEEIGNISPDLIAEADPTAPTVTRKTTLRRKFTIAAVCASLALLLVFALAALPYFNREEPFTAELPEELLEYADSEYIRLIYSLYNNSALGIIDHSSSAGGMITNSMGDSSSRNNYVEVTDNQVEGVIEGDLFKRSKTHIFYADARNKAINVYKIKGEKTTLSAQYQIDDTTLDGRDFTPREIYLSEDCDTLTVIGQFFGIRESYRGNTYSYKTVLASFDVSNPNKIKLKKTVVVAGEYITARAIDGSIYLLYEFGIMNSFKKDYSDEARFVPQIDTGNGFKSIDMKDIVIADGASEDIYTVLLRVDEDSLRIEDIKAILGPTNEVFVSEDRIILVDNYLKYYEYEENSEKHIRRSLFSDISIISIGKRKMEYITRFTLTGSVEGQYFIDEYNGILRIVANTDFWDWRGDVWLETDSFNESRVRVGDGFDSKRDFIAPGMNASLYCIDTNSWEIVAEVVDFAPWGEEAVSVRYDGNAAYVCTAEVVTFNDPVYFFDLSDLGNITYTDTGTIDGYSSSLVDFGEEVLLGIGYGDDRSIMKLEVYKEGTGKVESVCAYTKENAWYSEDYKTYYINRELGLVGLMYRSEKEYTYILLHFDGNSFTEIFSESVDETHMDVVRGTLIDDCFYIFAQGQYRVVKLDK